MPTILPGLKPTEVELGTPLWWVHLAALHWLAAGTILLYGGNIHEALMAYVACLTTSIPTVCHLFGVLRQGD
jgi:hypothetical protein